MSRYFIKTIICALMLIVVSVSKSKNRDKVQFENNEADTGFLNQAKQILKELVDIAADRIFNFRFFPPLDVARALVDNFDTETIITDLTEAKEIMRGLEFDKYDENHGHRVLKGIKLDEFEDVVRVIAASNNLPEKFVNEILLGKHMDENKSQSNQFEFNVGKDSDAWYCVVETVKVGTDKFDLALAYYNLKFKMADREKHHSKVQRFFGIPLWSNEWTTSEPRKLSANDKSLFMNFLRGKAITGFMKDHHYIASDDTDNFGHHGEL